MDLQHLDTTGFLITGFRRNWNFLRANYGGGLVDTVALPTDEPRRWTMKIDVLPDNFDNAGPIKDTQLTRAAYLYKFISDSKEAGDVPFWFRYADPGEDEREWLASFADDFVDFNQLCDRVFSTGLTLKQRVLRDQESPGEPTPIQNPDQM